MDPFRIPGARRILIEEGLATASGGNIAPRITGKLPEPEGDNLEWRLLGVETVVASTSVTTGGAVTAANMSRPWTNVLLSINGWPEPAYNLARGEHVYRMVTAQFGRPLANPGVISAAITTSAIRQRFFYPLAGVLGNTWYDTAPRADLVTQFTVQRDDGGLPAGASYVASPTMDVYAWVAPCSKVGEVTIPFSFSSWLAPSDMECVVPAADRVWLIMASDTDDALVNTVTMQQLRIGGRPMLDIPVAFNGIVADFNRTVFNDGFRSAEAITEITGATGAAASPEWLPIYHTSGPGRNYLKGLSCSQGVSASFSADFASGTGHYGALRSWDPIPGGAVEAKYLSAIKHRGKVNRIPTSKKDGHRPGLPYRIIQG